MSEPNIQRAPPPPLTLDRFLERYRTPARRANIAPLYEAMLAEARQLAQPAAIVQPCGPDAKAGLAAWVPRAADFVVGVCTLGPALEQRVQALFDDEAASAVVLDEIGVAQLTAFVRQVHQGVRRSAAERGLKAGPAYRPGVGRLPLEAQRLVFEALPAHAIGVTLNEQLVMQPAKSTSIVIPLFDHTG